MEYDTCLTSLNFIEHSLSSFPMNNFLTPYEATSLSVNFQTWLPSWGKYSLNISGIKCPLLGHKYFDPHSFHFEYVNDISALEIWEPDTYLILMSSYWQNFCGLQNSAANLAGKSDACVHLLYVLCWLTSQIS